MGSLSNKAKWILASNRVEVFLKIVFVIKEHSEKKTNLTFKLKSLNTFSYRIIGIKDNGILLLKGHFSLLFIIFTVIFN